MVATHSHNFEFFFSDHSANNDNVTGMTSGNIPKSDISLKLFSEDIIGINHKITPTATLHKSDNTTNVLANNTYTFLYNYIECFSLSFGAPTPKSLVRLFASNGFFG